MESVYLARQPILDRNSDICAYEILYRDVNKASHIESDRYASATVISNILNKFGTKALLEDKRAFIKVDEKFLLNDIIFSIPKDFFVFDILESVVLDERVIERIQQLHAKGYLLAINDTKLIPQSLEKYREVFKEINFFKIDFDVSMETEVAPLLQPMKKLGIELIATKIEDSDTYEVAQKIGFDCFQGYFFAKPKIVENAKYEPAQMNVLNLYNLLIQDTDIADITAEFEKTPEITVQLLQFINSGAFHFRNKISSIHHVITLMGRITLAKWLMLMIYSKSLSKNKHHEPLMLMVQNRTQLMELILKDINPEAGNSKLGEAYLVGVLSLIDTIFSMPLENILKSINVSDPVKDALLEDAGLLGDIYKTVRDIENIEVYDIFKFEQKYKLAPGSIDRAVMEAIEKVNEFNNPQE
ncbi:EAL domain-containing protein [Sulfurimonas sp.]|uniref:EAL and HDOD domain-containing protein n=1 Tax=Sulfurimonas sp. TaxID=2022749 RepID=UPI002614DD92|nr:EAL domain-containing protein [Sulfurimonas sp.]